MASRYRIAPASVSSLDPYERKSHKYKNDQRSFCFCKLKKMKWFLLSLEIAFLEATYKLIRVLKEELI